MIKIILGIIILLSFTTSVSCLMRNSDSVNVTFSLDMSIQAKTGFFNPETDPVKIAGNFNEWNNGITILTDADRDSVFDVTLKLIRGEQVVFKFIIGENTWEYIENREYTISDENSTYNIFFNNIRTMPSRLIVTFIANMRYELEMGKFSPLTDSLTVRGDFNKWSDTNIMHMSSENSNIFEFTDTFYVSENYRWIYKFVYKTPDTLIWEGDPNKLYIFTMDDIGNESVLIKRTFNDFSPFSLNNDDLSFLVGNPFYLHQNYPNPFNPSTSITFSIPEAGLVTLKIFDLLGREVTTLINEEKYPGAYSVNFNAPSLPSGTYFYRINSGKYTATRKMLLLE